MLSLPIFSAEAGAFEHRGILPTSGGSLPATVWDVLARCVAETRFLASPGQLGCYH